MLLHSPVREPERYASNQDKASKTDRVESARKLSLRNCYWLAEATATLSLEFAVLQIVLKLPPAR
jgi:hypothetical protein